MTKHEQRTRFLIAAVWLITIYAALWLQGGGA